MIGNPTDECECGDYRRSHYDGTGRCELAELCRPTPCLRFRLYKTATPEQEDGR